MQGELLFTDFHVVTFSEKLDGDILVLTASKHTLRIN